MQFDRGWTWRQGIPGNRRGGKRKSSRVAARLGNSLSLEPLERRLMLTAVVSINRNSAQNISAGSVAYTVAFNTVVTGVDGTDFRLTTTGSAGGTTPVGVAGSGASYTVTVSGVHGSGNLRLDLIDNDSIVDGASVPLGGVGAANGSYQGQTYTVGQAYPFVQSINRTTPPTSNDTSPTVVYTVTFNESVTGVDEVTLTHDFALVTSGSVSGAAISSITGSGAVYTVTISGISGTGTLGLNLVDDGTIRDADGNPLVQSTTAAAFAAQSTTAVGTFPVNMVAADLNLDGKPDLVVSNSDSNSLNVLLGNGNGTFQPKTTLTAGLDPTFVAVSDVNGDAKPDLIYINGGDNNVSVRLGNGDGTFQSPANFGTGESPTSVAVGDVNGDGKPDLAVASVVDNYVGVLLGNGNGTFQAQTTYTTGSGSGLLFNFDTYFVAIADVNADGKPDLIATNAASNTISVLLGNGNGTFQGQNQFNTGGAPIYLAVGDLNGDGKLDVVVANSSDNNVGVLLGNGNGTFQSQVTYATGLGPATAPIADMNGDGKLDLVVGNTGDNNGVGSSLGVLLGNGNGTFQTMTTFASGLSPGAGGASDLNLDGRNDTFVVNAQSNTIGVYLSNTSGNFTGQVYTINVTGSPPVVDLNGAGGGINFTSTWTGGSAVNIADATATVTDDGGTLASIKVVLNSPHTGDVLAATTTGSITQSFVNNTLTLSGTDSVANYQTVLRSVTYNNTAGGPGRYLGNGQCRGQ